MATQESTIQYLTSQCPDAGRIRFRKMFGEYALYCNDKVIALVCDDRLYVKPTEQVRAFAGQLEEAPAYPGSSLFLLVDEERWVNPEWMAELIRMTESDLPVPKPKKPRKKK